MITLAIALIALVVAYLYSTRTFRYWEKRGVKHDKPIPLFGNNLRNYLVRKSVTEMAVETYWKYPKEKVVGFFRGTGRELVIRDPDIIKQILTVDFQYFYPRGLVAEKYGIEPMFRNLFFADGDLWRLLRQRMTPAFSSGKLRAMFPLIEERAERLRARALAAAAAGATLDARDLMARYTTDFIGACGFGLDANSLNEENSAFRQLGLNIFDTGPVISVKAVLKDLFPVVFKSMKLLGKVEKEVVALVKEILEQRNSKPSGRNDFIDLLIECKQKGKLVGESIEKIKPDGTPEIVEFDLDEVLMAAQVFVFFAAGFETSSSATSYTLHQLAYHPEVQKKVQDEIDRVLAKYDNKLCYDAIKEMTYLTWTFKEGMRMFPSLGFLIRECARPYTFKDLNMSIDKEVTVIIPLQALHNDPKYFENPEEFRPERFDPEQFKQENKFVYLPFGVGPRACIGERMGLMQSLAGLAAVLSRFSVSPAAATCRHPRVHPASDIVQSIKGGIPLLFRERKHIS
ncbi:cytochrome P450 6B6-like [Epargyreus clarus]|uniref:cytochrome P450 6B6-like n=1 Tax=Epargyreus clarus TaxID=520877 RepID=UPI003C2B3C02